MTEQKTNKATGQGDQAIHVDKWLAVLWRGRLLIALCFIPAVLLGGYKAYVASTPLYKASAVVMLNNREEQVVDIESVIGNLGTDQAAMNTEVEILRSRSLLRKVVEELDLTVDPEFNAVLQPVGLVDEVKDKIKISLGLKPVTLPVAPEEKKRRDTERAINAILEKFSVRNVPQSLVFQITFETTSPEKSAKLANTLVELYILNQLEVKFDATQQATTWLTNRVAELQIDLEAAEAKVTAFRSSIDLISDEALQGLEVQIKETRDRIQSLRNGQGTDEDLAAQIAGLTDRTEIAEALGDTQLRQLLVRIDQPSIQEAFDQQVAQIIARADQSRDRATAQLAALESALVDLEAQLERQNNDQIILQQLTREAEASRLLYEYFLSRLKETSAQQGIQQADSRILSEAVRPIQPSAPRKSLILASSGFLGLLCGCMLVLLLEMRHTAFRRADDLEDETGTRVLGQVPVIPGRKRDATLKYLTQKPTSAAAEAVRNLRTSIMLTNLDTPPKVIMTSSATPGEGKTTLALALALSTAGMGRKVLIIEGDTRRSVFKHYLEKGEQKIKGFAQILEKGEDDFSAAIRTQPELGCDVLFAGQSSANPADLFSSQRFSDMIKSLRKEYDQILIDTPPILVVPDARIIAHHVDLIAFAVHWNLTPRAQVTAALNEFASGGRPVDGLVLNKINPRGMKRYGYGGKYGTYASYGSKYYTN